MEISGNVKVNEMVSFARNTSMSRHNDPVIKGKIAKDGKPTDLVIAAKSIKDGSAADLVIKGKTAQDGKATDLVIAANQAKKSKQTDLVISAESKAKSGKSSKAALDNFVRKNPASWKSGNGQKTGHLTPKPYK